MSWTSLITYRRAGLAAVAIALVPALSGAQGPLVAPNAPKDSPVLTAQKCIWVAMDQAMQPYIAQARSTWPQARKRYLAGLPPYQSFFVTALLVDEDDRREQVFIAVDRIQNGEIK